MGKERYLQRFLAMKKSGSYFIIVMVDKETDQIAATGSLITEFKFVRNNGMCGHIEDITVSKQRQGQKLGFYLIQTLTELGEKIGCYKNILDCFESNQGMSVWKGPGVGLVRGQLQHTDIVIRSVRVRVTGFYEKCDYTLKGVQMAKYKK